MNKKSAFKKPLSFLLLASSLFYAAASLAHAPRLSCYQSDDKKQVECEGGFSDGSKASGTKINVLSYDEDVIWSGTLDEQSEIVFKRPEGDFYIRFEGGEGHTVEVDQSEID